MNLITTNGKGLSKNQRTSMKKKVREILKARKSVSEGCPLILLDGSGSMSGDKWQAACGALRTISERARVQVLVFSDTSADEFTPSYILEETKPAGGTPLFKALETAFQRINPHFIIITDGLPTDSNPDTILHYTKQWQKRGETKRISCIAIGTDADLEFLSKLSTDGKCETETVLLAEQLQRSLENKISALIEEAAGKHEEKEKKKTTVIEL